VVGVEGDGQALVGSSNNNNGFFGFGNNGNNTSFPRTPFAAGPASPSTASWFTAQAAWPLAATAMPGQTRSSERSAACRPSLPLITPITRASWYAAGAGVEYAFTPNWSVKVEYLFTDPGRNSRTFVAPGGLVGFTFNNREQNRILRAGLNYRFGWAGVPVPVLARY
jgi:hypothetical protein